mmetsp:Transcript_3985/g.6305  ORF Transcript_3985/g.6305 Transcript_3985/m.6305 type:complete len:248 (+) Transcript_3985:397-1140(+)
MTIQPEVRQKVCGPRSPPIRILHVFDRGKVSILVEGERNPSVCESEFALGVCQRNDIIVVRNTEVLQQPGFFLVLERFRKAHPPRNCGGESEDTNRVVLLCESSICRCVKPKDRRESSSHAVSRDEKRVAALPHFIPELFDSIGYLVELRKSRIVSFRQQVLNVPVVYLDQIGSIGIVFRSGIRHGCYPEICVGDDVADRCGPAEDDGDAPHPEAYDDDEDAFCISHPIIRPYNTLIILLRRHDRAV